MIVSNAPVFMFFCYCKAAKNKGVLPSAADVFRQTHFKEVPNVGRVPANRHVQQIEVS